MSGVASRNLFMAWPTQALLVAACMGCHGQRFPSTEGNLRYAAETGNINQAEIWLGRGASVNETSGAGQTPLDVAVCSRQVEFINWLISHGAEIDVFDVYEESPLLNALYASSFDLADLLIANGANVNAVNEYGHSAIFKAISWSRLDIVDYLIRRGADVNLIDKCGVSPLQHAASIGDVDVVKRLLEAGADPCYEGGKWGKPSGIASKFGHTELAELLESQEK